MRLKKLKLNTISSVLYQVVAVICGFVLPRLIIINYGSTVNGLASSISQFLSVISFLELGMGAVVQSSLYRPLAEKDDLQISKIVTSANRFFRRIAIILAVYILVLLFVYPTFINREFSWLYTALLILAISISYFAQYYFGVVDRLLLTADQRGYIQYTAQAITLLANTVFCAILMKGNVSIQVVKLVTSIVYLIRPFVLRLYVNRHYAINRNEWYDEEPISQKWNGVAQHIAACVLDGTDTIVLTLFSTLENVSIYSVYFLVVNGVKQLVLVMMNGVQSLMGELLAKNENDNLKSFFGYFEWILHNAVVLIFGCMGVLILPFIQIYTSAANDVNYYQPLFAFLIVLANAAHCLRLPYNMLILAAGHYKQTQWNYITAMLINIFISVIAVVKWGLIGVALGTLIAMMYQTVWMAVYDSNNIIGWPIKNFVKQGISDVIIVIMALLGCSLISIKEYTYVSLFVYAIKIGLIWAGCISAINMLLFGVRVKETVSKFKCLLKRGR